MSIISSSVNLVFVIGAPRSGTTMLERMLSSHSQIQGGPEPHLLTPLAHLGVWDKVDKAPYDHVLAAQAQKGFVSQLPKGEQDYWDACRAYCDVLYGRYTHAKGDKPYCLDKTPAYALVLPFMTKVYPDSSYIVLTRHPLAIFSSYANSFFNGDYEVAHDFNPIIERYVPALAAFLRSNNDKAFHVCYEQLVREPEPWFERICAHIGVPYEADAINYGETKDPKKATGLGDPIGVSQHKRPTTASVKKWVAELATDPGKLALAKKMIAAVNPDDLATIGYPVDTLWKVLEEAGDNITAPKAPKATRYRLERGMIIRLRRLSQRNNLFRSILKKSQLICDILLRE
ncbi:MAG: sulfotransferase [Candidatus Hydrogenedentes bacterium]|nr:sulfotransferase [Candidatus Hydrogenedentota bacterium]